MQNDFMSYFRPGTLPHMWCPGCGNGIAVQGLLRAIDQLGLDRDKIVLVGGIGCSSRAVGYLDFNTLHTTHGRALAFATGVKMARPELIVFVIMGDGDATAIGGNHLIHAARRNMNLNVLMLNNNVYGMTGGQYSPLTPTGGMSTTSPYGNIERNLDAPELLKGAGASYVARGTAFHAKMLQGLIAQGIENNGFSFIEVIVQCPTSFGRKNNMPNPSDMLLWQKEHGVPLERYRELAPGEAQGKFPIGVLHRESAPEYTEQYAAMLKRRGSDGGGGCS